eukprot:GFKZ01000034.1.p1 GENE.GFKZ01000034.1~~GFKZ01000034.1.p1  ORF type:complete len:5357 (-),score=648.29 GFKZ01000034.1:273-16343(-)
MEQLFAVRVLVHYHDKSNVDHAAVRRLLAAAAVDSLTILLADGTSVQLSSYIKTNPSERKPIADVSGSSGSSLTQVASVFMLAEARAAADALPSSPHELETACSSLERLLGCLATKRPQLPVRDIKQFARVKLGTAARRRAVHRLLRSGSGSTQFSLLKAVNAILRLCDVATHCLAVVSRQSVSSKASCETAVAISTRLLTLAASLYEIQKVDTTPALSFFSSNSLRTALVAGAMHLGAISVEHLEIEPMTWIHVANRIVMSNSISPAPKTSVLSALFGGMIKAAKRYEGSERDTRAAEGALCLLSTLHVVLETDIVRDTPGRDESEVLSSKEDKQGQRTQHASNVNPTLVIGTGAVSQAARSFLGERVVSAEEDGDEGRIAARTVYQACEEYAERAGEGDGIMGLLSRLFASAGRQSRSEATDEPVVSISDGTLIVQPDESDASSDGSHLRPESPPFLIDVFDQRSKDGFGASATIGSTSEAGVDHMDRIELHREIGALALDTLAHWISRPEAFQRYSDLDRTAFCLKLCQSAAYFSLGNSSASYELRAAMVDFGSLLGPLLLQDIAKLSLAERDARWSALVTNLVSSCRKMNPILRGILSCKSDAVSVKALLHAFLEGYQDNDLMQDHSTDGVCRLPVESLLNILLHQIDEDNSIQVIQILTETIKKHRENQFYDSSLAYRTSCVTLLSHALLVSLGVNDGLEDARVLLAALFNRDVENLIDPSFPEEAIEGKPQEAVQAHSQCSSERLSAIIRFVEGVTESADQICFEEAKGSWDSLSAKASLSRDATTHEEPKVRTSRNEKLYFHALWSCTLLHKSLFVLSQVSDYTFHGLRPSGRDDSKYPLCAPFVCMKALESPNFFRHVNERLKSRIQGSMTLLYTAECLALSHPQYLSRTDQTKSLSGYGLEFLLIHIVRNVVSIASDYTYDDVTSNFNALQRSFQKSFSLNNRDASSNRPNQVHCFPTSRSLSRGENSLACLQLGMSYVRSIGTLRSASLLGDVMLTAVYILNRLNSQQISLVKHLTIDLAQVLLFLPDTFLPLAQSILVFLKQLLCNGFREFGGDAKRVEDAVIFVARYCGFERIVGFGSSSNAAIHLLCKFARDSSEDAIYDTSALEAALSPDKFPQHFSKDLAELLTAHSSNVSFTEIMPKLLTPADDSAVVVSSHAESISALTQACGSSAVWHRTVFKSLSQLILEDVHDFSTKLIRRSVMQSATLNDVVLMIFDRVISSGSGLVPSEILRKAFVAARDLFKRDEDCNVESRVRLLNFAARLSVCDGRLSRSNEDNSYISLLECDIFELTVDSLETIVSSCRNDTSDSSSRQIVMFLCVLLDCFLVGIYGISSSFFDNSVHAKSASVASDSSSSTKLDIENRSENVKNGDQQVGSANNSSDVWSALEESTKSSLCTYTTTGSQFVEQHWYFCYTCDLAGSEGVCSVCARVCHSGCELAYSKFGRFFCDCGAGSDPQHENASNAMSASEDGDGVASNPQDTHVHSVSRRSRKRRPCQCLSPPAASNSAVLKRTANATRSMQEASSSKVLDDLIDIKLRNLLVSEIRECREEPQRFSKAGISRIQRSFEKIVKSSSRTSSLISTALQLVAELDGEHIVEKSACHVHALQDFDKQAVGGTARPDFVGTSSATTLAEVTKVHKPGSLDITKSSGPSKPDYFIESLISFSPGRRVIAVSKKSGFIEFINAGEALDHSSGSTPKVVANDYPATSIPFDILFLQFHPANGNILMVVGKEKVSILSREVKNGSWRWSRSEVKLRLNEYQGSEGRNELRSALWVESRDTSILVTTSKFIKLFDVCRDLSSPRFFALCPSPPFGVESALNQTETQQRVGDPPKHAVIAAASFLDRIELPSMASIPLFCVLMSDGALYLARMGNGELNACSTFLCNIQDCLKREAPDSAVTGLAYHPAESVLAISFSDGNLLCISVAIRIGGDTAEASVRWMRLFKDALPGGCRPQLRPIPGVETWFLFYHQGQTLKASGALEITCTKSLRIQYFSGSPSAGIRGISAYPSFSLAGFPRRRGGFLALDDGSLHRIDIVKDNPRPQVAGQSILSSIAERQRIRAMRSSNLSNSTSHGYSSVPSSVGFFEKCRLVSDHISIEASGTNRRSDSVYERMAVTLAGGGGDCVVSPKENEPFKFVATVDNQAIVLVGARLRFGGTDRSRNRVPAEVKVFGRLVRWKSRNGVKRWLDVPFTVPESAASPQRVLFELFPRRSLRHSRTNGDGHAAVDCLELHAVSNIEFTERKVVYENEKSRRYDELTKKQKDASGLGFYKLQQALKSTKAVDGSEVATKNNTTEQAALLTALNTIDSKFFFAASKSTHFMLMINNLWSSTFEGSISRDSQFLDQVLRPCLQLFKEDVSGEDETQFSAKAAELLTKASKLSSSKLVDLIATYGAPMHMIDIERCLFAVSGIARSLIIAGCSDGSFDSPRWSKCFSESMPDPSVFLMLLRAFLSMGVVGRMQLRSSDRAALNIVDVFLVYAVHHSMQRGPLREENDHGGMMSKCIVAMMVDLDQNLRLHISQRLIELCDAPVAAAEGAGSPFESILAMSFVKRVKRPASADEVTSSSATDVDDANEDADSSQRWAYRCDSCGEVCDQEWWHCTVREDFDLCTSCLRKPNLSLPNSHTDQHLMLRRNVNEDGSEEDELSDKQVSPALTSIQRAIGPVIDRFLMNMTADNDFRSSWRYLDGAETIVQLVGRKSPVELRATRLQILFDSSFTETLGETCEKYAYNLDCAVEEERMITSSPRQAYSLLLFLRVILWSRGSTMPLHLHSAKIPSILLSLLKSMHRYAVMLSKAVNSGIFTSSSGAVAHSLVSSAIWNESVTGLSYDILPEKQSNKQCMDTSGMFHFSEELGECSSTFLSLMASVLEVLEYCFKSAASASISEQMQQFPRDLLCGIINQSESTYENLQDSALFKECSVSATRVLSALCFDDADALHDALDKQMYDEQSRRLKEIAEGFSITAELVLDYERALKVARIMATLHKATERHPATWRRFVLANEGILTYISEAAKALDGQIRVHSLQLLSAGVSVSDDMALRVVKGLSLSDIGQHIAGVETDSQGTGEGNGDGDNGNILSDLLQATKENEQVNKSVFHEKDGLPLDFLVHEVMLKSQLKAARIAASHILISGILRAAKGEDDKSFVSLIHGTLMTGIDLMPFAGELADGFVECLRFFVICCQNDLFGLQSEPLLTSMALSMTTSLRRRCSLLVSHPNARLYVRLSGSLDINGYFLESDPCMSCSASMCESSEKKECRLDTIRAETKYTDSAIMHRLLSTHEVSAVSVKVIDPRRSRRAKSIDVLYSSRTVSDAAELKSADHPWRKLRSLELGPTSCEACVELLVPVAAANIKFHFVDFHRISEVTSTSRDSQDTESIGSASHGRRSNVSSGMVENLQCPRCSRSVTDRHGICRNCHENAYQCRQCRNINYENLDGFLCNECGYCKHGRFEFSVTGRPTFVAERISSEEDRKRASRIIEKEAGNIHRCMDQLIKLRSSMIRSLNSGVPTEEPKDRARLFTGRGGLADILDSVAPRSEIAVLEALLEQGHASQEIEEAANSTHGGISVTDEVIADSNGSADPSERDQNNQTGSGLASPVNRGRHEQSKISGNHGGTISKTTTALAGTYSKECRSVFATMSRGIRVLTLTRTELVRYANSVGGSRLQYANDIAKEEGLRGKAGDSSALLGSDGWNTIPGQQTVCYGCTQAFISKCVIILQTMMRRDGPAASAIQSSNIAKEMILVCSLCEKGEVRKNICDLITYLVNDNLHATQLVCAELARKIEFCIDSFETVDSHSVARFEMSILETTATLDDNCWEERLKLVIRILFKASKYALTCSSVAESIILPCLRVALRLMRVDSELTAIENASLAEGGSATDVVSNEGVPAQASENSETENEYLDRAMHIALVRGTRDGDFSANDRFVSGEPARRTENLEDVRPGAAGSAVVLGNAVQALSDNQSLRSTRENVRHDERRQVGLRLGSDVVSGSGAPSSVETAADGHLSDDETNICDHRQDGGIDIRAINNMLENDHDSKLLSADVEEWLQGKMDQSSWIAGMKERSQECEEKEKGSYAGELVIQRAYMKTCFEKWRHSGAEVEHLRRLSTAEVNNQQLRRLSIEEDNWVVRLMLFTPCSTVRKEACALLELICGQEETLELQLLDVLTGPALHLGADVGEKSKEFFDLLETTLSPPSHRLYLIAKKFLPRLAALIRSRAERLIMCEANAESSLRLVNFMEGYSLKRLLSLLRQTLEAIPSQRSELRERLFKVDDYTLIWSLQRAYICVRKLISLRTKLTDDCGSQLCDILLSKEFLFTGPMVTAVVSACVSELRAARRRRDAQAIAILLEQLCLMLCPERKEPICYLSLNKAPTQEEFIRGSMARNPYPSSSFDGPLMRDVKNKICKDLDLPGLLEDDFAMELLVAGNLVKLDLPIMAVYDHVWRGSTAASMASSMQPTQISRTLGLRRTSHSMSRGSGGSGRQGNIRSTIFTFRRVNSDRDSLEEDGRPDARTDPPMVVIYRLSGLDGEATEPIVDSVPAESSDEQDAEELYGDTVVFGEVGGFDVLFDLLSIVGSWGDDAGTAVRVPALRLLRASCEVAKNRTLLAKSPNAVRTLLDCAASAFEHAQGSPTAVISAESLLIAAEQILAQQQRELESHASKRPETMNLSPHDPEEVMSRVQVFLGRLSLITSPKAEHSILHLLPFLIQGVPGAIEITLEYFHFSWDSIDTSDDARRKAKQLGTVLLATPHDLRGDKFAEEAILSGIARKAVEYVVSKFPMPRNSNKSQWESSLDYPGPPLVLRLITGLSLFLELRQAQQAARGLLRKIFREEKNIIPVLCQLEMAVSGNAIGTTTEELLEAMARDSDIGSEIDAERDAIKKARREAAKASRMNILRETGLTKLTVAPAETVEQGESGNSKRKDEPTIFDFMEDVLDEEGPACVVCGDGFRCRPEEALCFYVFCRKVPLDLSTGPHAAGGSQSDENGGTLGQVGTGHVELELFSSGRGRGQGGMSSRSGANACYTTVTHLNAIHMSCHKEASRADRSSRRDEWDGAFLRNSHTKCNNMFPIRPPITCKEGLSSDDQIAMKQAKLSYSAAVENYFARLSSLARTSLPHPKAVKYDLGRSLLRFANGGAAVFSEHAKGGGPHSNACLIPSMVSLAIYLLQSSPSGEGKKGSIGTEGKNIETQEAALDKFLKEEEVGDITYYIASGLILRPLKTWESCAGLFLGRGLRDGVLKKDVLLRLIAFADLVNRVLKRNVQVREGERWLDRLLVHIGSDEKFGQEFGDVVNERWELYIRKVDDDETFLKALRQNGEIGDEETGEGRRADEAKEFVEEMRQCLQGGV